MIVRLNVQHLNHLSQVVSVFEEALDRLYISCYAIM
jgi:hypothetical protein